MNLSPTQKKILYVGIPVVLVLGVVAYLRSRSSSSSTATTAAAAPSGTTTSSNTPIGLDQLTSFESQVTAQLGQLGQAVQAVQQAQTSQPAPPSNSTGYYPTPNPTATTPQTIAPPTSSGTTAPTPAPAPSNPYSHIDTPQAGSVIAASGQTIYGEPQPGVFVPVVENGQWTAAGQAYQSEQGNPGLFTTAGAGS